MVRDSRYQLLRIAFGLLTLAAIVTQLWIGVTERDARVSNFLSFFTIESNLLTVAVLLAGAALAMRGQETSPGWELFRGAVVAYMTTTFIVFAALLSGLPDNLDLTEPWVNFVLHQLMPIVMILDWIVSPPRHRWTVRQALVWMLFPLAYGVYSLIRGPIVEWYPYPFLNPDSAGGYPGVAAYSVGIAVLFVGIVWFVVTIGNMAHDWWATRDPGSQPAIDFGGPRQ
ncbi:MAG: Pr6Pr family membrane protein [Chloroflexia bacterium]|nr:Pr6Pr family membrane protein [Chloroflexia bacterium]